MPTGSVLITGATGNVGSEVLRLLQLSQAQPIVAAVRAGDDARKPLPKGTASVVFDFESPDTWKPALQGVKRLFLVRPPAISNVKKHIVPFLTEAKAQGVEHIVFLSLLGAESNSLVPHYAVEQHLFTLGVPYTLLRPSFFMQNLDTTHRLDIKERSEIYVPAGKGKTGFIDARDIAAVGALALSSDAHFNKAYPLTGGAALTYTEVAEIFSRELGRKITYPNPSMWSFYWRMKSQGHAAGFIFVMIAIYTTAKLGFAATLTSNTATLLGRAPIAVEQYAKDYRAVWL